MDLDEDIVISNWDISILTPSQMDTLGEILKKRVKQHNPREEKKKKKKKNKVLDDIKSIVLML